MMSSLKKQRDLTFLFSPDGLLSLTWKPYPFKTSLSCLEFFRKKHLPASQNPIYHIPPAPLTSLSSLGMGTGAEVIPLLTNLISSLPFERNFSI